MTENFKQFLLVALLVILSFVLRWEYVKNTNIIHPIRADAYEYTMIAHNLANDHVFTSERNHQGKPSHEARPPGYVFFLAAIVSLTDSFQAFYISILFIQCLFGAGTVGLVYALARFMFPPFWSALAALFVALSPHMIVMSAYILTESLFTLLLLLATVLLVWACQKGGAGRLLLAGVILGLGIFVRPVLALFPLLCLPIFFFVKKEKKKSRVLAIFAFFLLASFSLQASWSIWRTATLGFESKQTSQFKTALVCGTYPGITYRDLPGMPYREDPEFQQIMDKDYTELFRHIVQNIQDNPGRYLKWWLVGKPMMFWSWHVFFSDGVNFYPIEFSWFDTSPPMKMLRSIMLGVHPALVALSIIGIVLFGLGRFQASSATIAYILCFVLVAHFSLMFMVLAPFPRYALPLGPELYVMSVFALWKMTGLIKKRWRTMIK